MKKSEEASPPKIQISELTRTVVRLKKKSLNSDNMKERHFVLEKDQLCYFKSDKTSKFF